jgi:plastocyanin
MSRVLAATIAIALGCSLLTAAPAAPSPRQPPRATTSAVKRVTIRNFKFAPARIVVARGTRIVWSNRDGATHTVVSKAGRWSSRNLATGASFARTLRRAGTFPYICSIHPFMHGTVVVR